jgi:polar amino acid transport system permease protein
LNVTNWDRFLDSFFNLRVAAEYLPKIIDGFWLTIILAGCIILTGVAAGLALAVVRSFAIRPLNWLIIFLVDLFRALPPLVIIALLYFGLPAAGLSLSGFTAAWLSLSLVLMAFTEEIFWAGITAVPRGQWEAARSTGLGFLQTLRMVVLPQALRMVIPPLTNRTIAITKGTALASVVAVQEILGAAQAGVSFSFNPTPLTLGALAYVVLFFPVVILGRWVETRFAWKR